MGHETGNIGIFRPDHQKGRRRSEDMQQSKGRPVNQHRNPLEELSPENPPHMGGSTDYELNVFLFISALEQRNERIGNAHNVQVKT